MNRPSKYLPVFLGSFFVCSIFASLLKTDIGGNAPAQYSARFVPAHVELVVSYVPGSFIGAYFSPAAFLGDRNAASVTANDSPDYRFALVSFENLVRITLKSGRLSSHTAVSFLYNKFLPDESSDEEVPAA